MRFVVIVEAGDDVSAKPAVTLKRADIEQGWDIRCTATENLWHELASRPAADVCPVLFAEPLRSVQFAKVTSGQQATAIGDNVDIATSYSGNRKNLVDCKIRCRVPSPLRRVSRSKWTAALSK